MTQFLSFKFPAWSFQLACLHAPCSDSWLLSRAQLQVAEPSKARVYGRSLAEIAGSNAAEGMDVCLL